MISIQGFGIPIASFLIVVGVLRQNALAALPELRTVALSGQLAPGLGPRTYNLFSPPVINRHGSTAFVSQLNCCGAAYGAWSEGTGTGLLTLVALEGGSAQPGGLHRFFGFGIAQLDNLGRVTLRGEMTDTPPEFDGVWTGENLLSLDRIAVSGDQVVGAPPGRTYFGIATPSVAHSGFMAGVENPQGSSIYKLLWTSDGDAPAQQLLAAGDPVPFAEPGTVFEGYDDHVFYEPIVNNARQIALRASFNTIPIEPNFDDHLLRINSDGSIESVVDTGDHANGFPADVKFGSISTPVMNNRGDFAFGARIGPFGFGSREGIWIKKDGELPQIIASENDSAPGFPGSFFDTLFFSDSNRMPLAISDRGDVAFWASIVGGAYNVNFGESIWIGSVDSGLRPVVVERQVAPGTGGAVFSSMTSTIGDMLYEMAMNRHSQLAVLATVEINSENRPGLFATDRDGELHAIVVYNDFIEVAPGVLKQVDSINFESPLEVGQASGLNDRGEVAFSIRFKDGSSGVFVSSLVAVPEPATIVLLIAGVLAVSPRACALLRPGAR